MKRLMLLKQSFISSCIEVKAFLHRLRWKETLTFFGFVFVSFAFWMMISLQEVYETKISVPLRYSNLPADVILEETAPKAITVQIKAKGSALFGYSFLNSIKPIEVNKTAMDEYQEQLILTRESIETEINKLLSPSTNLIDFNPKSLEISYGIRKSKLVPVVLNSDIRYSPGYQQLEEPSFSPKEIIIYGTEENLSKVNTLQTTHLSLSKVEESIDQSIELEIPKGIVSAEKKVNLHLPVEAFLQTTYHVPITCRNLSSNYSLRTFPSTISIECAIPLSKSKKLSDKDFEMDLDFKLLEQNSDGVLPITLTKRPDWLKHFTVKPKTIEFILEYKQ